MELLQWFIIFLIKKISGGTVKNETISNKELAEELHKPITKKFEKRKVHSPFIMLLSKCSVCNTKKSKLLKEEEEARGLLSKMTGIKVPILRDLLITSILF